MSCHCQQNNCPSCTDNYQMSTDCCNTCGCNTCSTNTCCTSCKTGPQEVTDEQLGHECSWFYVTVFKNCCEQPIRVNPNRFAAFLAGSDAFTTQYYSKAEVDQMFADLRTELGI